MLCEYLRYIHVQRVSSVSESNPFVFSEKFKKQRSDDYGSPGLTTIGDQIFAFFDFFAFLGGFDSLTLETLCTWINLSFPLTLVAKIGAPLKSDLRKNRPPHPPPVETSKSMAGAVFSTLFIKMRGSNVTKTL